MGDEQTQPFCSTLRLPPRMRLAPAERERLWKGLERFVNCGDDLADCEALGRSFPDFWPVGIKHAPFHEETAADADKRFASNLPAVSPLGLPRISLVAGGDPSEPVVRHYSGDELASMSEEDFDRLAWRASLAWHPVCHRLFLVYRDTLRTTWSGEGWLSLAEFLLGIADWNVDVLYDLTGIVAHDFVHWHESLKQAWRVIKNSFPTAIAEGPNRILATWGQSDFVLVPRNDFESAFYLLFRESWRARVCPRCNMFFVARKPKRIFCGTGCSAGSRLASKRKWWKRVGTKRRAKQRQQISKKTLRGRKHR